MTGYGEWSAEDAVVPDLGAVQDDLNALREQRAVVMREQAFAAVLSVIARRWPSEEWGRLAADALDPPTVGDVLDEAWGRADALHGKQRGGDGQ